MRRTIRITIITAVAVLLCLPLRAAAEDAPPMVAALPPVLITEVQTGLAGSGNASKESIELYNTTDQAIDIGGWHLWYVSGTASQTKHTISFHRTNADSNAETTLGAHQYYLLAGSNDASYLSYLARIPDQYYTATLSDNGTLQLIAPDDETQCTLDVLDQVGWGATAAFFERQAAPSPPASQSLQRYIDAAGTYLDTNDNANDFWVTNSSLVPTPGAASAQNPQRSDADLQAEEPTVLAPFVSLPEDDCTPTPPPSDDGSGILQPPTDQPPATIEDTPPSDAEAPSSSGSASGPSLPAADVGLTAPQITEVLPNPASPQTDAHDEFIELYNSNTTPFDLSGFTLEVGLTTKHYYTFPTGTVLPSKSFVAYFSSDTKLSLSNTAGQVWLLDPFGATISQVMQYGTAKDGQAWALANGSWYWTSKPSPNAANVITTTSVNATKSKKTITAGTKKTAASTSSKTKKVAKQAGDTATSAVAGAATVNPLHPAVLAIIGGFALLYGAYEYRQDVAHKLYQLRANRTARREARRSLQGWRGD